MQSARSSTSFVRSRALMIGTLIIAGEAVFFLPFVLPRVFRPTILDVFQINNVQLGSAFSVYGIIAMLAYFIGGPLADRYSARRLMTLALAATALGGLILTAIPSFAVVLVLYGFWGVSTILLFWAALLRATREWGGDDQQGRAYGMLDGGRGLVAAVMASATVALLASFLPDPDASALSDKRVALRQIIWVFTIAVALVAALVWWIIPDSTQLYQSSKTRSLLSGPVARVAKMPVVWGQAVIILCAYVGYKSTDNFSLFARDAFGYDDVSAAEVGTISFWVRPFIAVIAGTLADRFRSSNIIVAGFTVILLASLLIGMGYLRSGVYFWLLIMVISLSIGIYAIRAIYFALLQEAKIPFQLTGTAVGLVSVVGFTPDVFSGPLMGYFLDTYPGARGHEYVFLMLAGFALFGLIASLFFRRNASSRLSSDP